MKSKRWIQLKKSDGLPQENEYKLIEVDLPALGEGDILFKTLFISVDPFMRIHQRPSKTNACIGLTVAEVVESRHADYPVGRVVLGRFGWQTMAVANPKMMLNDDEQHPPLLQPLPQLGDLPPSLALGIVGMNGFAAYWGVTRVLRPKEGEVVLVSTAAGIVGSTAGQIAKLRGCKVIGCTGSDEKCKWLKDELGFDVVFNYKTTTLADALKKASLPQDCINCYFDNVGGEFAATVIRNHMAARGRVAVSGALSSYNEKAEWSGPAFFMSITRKQLRIEGFSIYEYIDEFPSIEDIMYHWILEGKLKYREHITEGFENTPKAFIGMLKGENTGKAIVKV